MLYAQKRKTFGKKLIEHQALACSPRMQPSHAVCNAQQRHCTLDKSTKGCLAITLILGLNPQSQDSYGKTPLILGLNPQSLSFGLGLSLHVSLKSWDATMGATCLKSWDATMGATWLTEKWQCS